MKLHLEHQIERICPKVTKLAPHGDLLMMTSSNASLTHCRVEQPNKLAKEHCQINATHPRTDTQQAEQRMQQDDQNSCTQKVFLNVTQAMKGLQDVHAKLMENIQERGATKKARKQPADGYMEVEMQNRHDTQHGDGKKPSQQNKTSERTTSKSIVGPTRNT